MAGPLAPPRRKTRRVFFALWPDEQTRQALALSTREAAESCGGRVVPASNFHVTLVFVGSVTASHLDELAVLGQRVVASTPLPAAVPTLNFDRVESWRKAGVLCATCSSDREDGVRFAGEWAGRLRSGLAESGYSLDPQGVFRPHVTLARKIARNGARAVQPVTWSYRDFVLIDSTTGPQGSVYSVLNTFSSDCL